MCQSSLFEKTKGDVSLWTKHSRKDFFLKKKKPKQRTATTARILSSLSSHFSLATVHYLSLCLVCLFPFQAISYMLFLNFLLLCTQGWIPATCIIGAVTYFTRLLPLAIPEVLRKRKYMHVLFKDTQITIYGHKGCQGKSRMQALLKKYLYGERILSHTPQSDFALAHRKPVWGSRTQFGKPCTTNTSLASRYFVHCCPGVTHHANLPSWTITRKSKPQATSSHMTSTLLSRWHLATEGL